MSAIYESNRTKSRFLWYLLVGSFNDGPKIVMVSL
jgi:hypothetical protein